MRPRLRRDAALRLTLNAIVADRGRRVETVLDIRLGQLGDVAGFERVLAPDATRMSTGQ